MKKFLTIFLLALFCLPALYAITKTKAEETLTTKESQEISQTSKESTTDTEIKEILDKLDLNSLSGENRRNKIYDLLKNNKNVFEIFESATKDADKLCHILSTYNLSNCTNDFYIVLNKILKENTNKKQDSNVPKESEFFKAS